MPELPLKIPLVNNETDEYEEPIRPHQDGLAARGFYPQDPSPAISSPPDQLVGLERDALDNLWLKDAFGSSTLAALRAGSQGTDVDFLLACEPPSPTNRYANTRAGGRVVRETWTNSGTDMLIKSIDYTRVAGRVAVEVRKVFAQDGTTVIGQLTVEYSRAGGKVVAATETRDI